MPLCLSWNSPSHRRCERSAQHSADAFGTTSFFMESGKCSILFWWWWWWRWWWRYWRWWWWRWWRRRWWWWCSFCKWMLYSGISIQYHSQPGHHDGFVWWQSQCDISTPVLPQQVEIYELFNLQNQQRSDKPSTAAVIVYHPQLDPTDPTFECRPCRSKSKYDPIIV